MMKKVSLKVTARLMRWLKRKKELVVILKEMRKVSNKMQLKGNKLMRKES